MKTKVRLAAMAMILTGLLAGIFHTDVMASAVTPTISSISQSGNTDKSITVCWNVENAASIQVYVKDLSLPKDQQVFNRVATVRAFSYTITGLAPGNKYDIQIIAINGENNKLTATKTLYGARTSLSNMGALYQKKWDTNEGKVTVEWEQMKAADGYEYMFENEKETKVLAQGSIGNTEKPSMKLNVAEGNIYKFSVRAFIQDGSKKNYTAWSSIWCIAQAQVKSVVKNKGKLTIKWKKVKGATGYDVYVSTGPQVGYKKVKSVGKKTRSVTIKKVGKKKISKKKKWYVCVMTRKGNSDSGAAFYYDSATGGKAAHEFLR
ncbi:MAG: fibronectin type III domain-containing protein [Lachnospiraceae bacterium]|nr:fibronectin type III domain-containing protein [Lachnospiraceae bacterium]